MIGIVDDKTYEVRSLCEHIARWSNRDGEPVEFCDRPTTYFYPAMGGGTMALCEDHARPHGNHAWPVV